MFSGSIVALVTPFTKEGEVDYAKIKELVEWHIAEGTNGIVPCGTTGESPTLSDEEQRNVIKTVVDVVNGRVPVIAGTGSYDTRHAVAMTEYAKECGADAALVISPYYNKPTQQGCIDHFSEVAKVGLPIVLYNHQGRTGTKLLPSTIATLSALPEVVAVKEACGDVGIVMDIKNESDITILSGDDNLTIPFIAVGAVGVISVIANVIPKAWANMVKEYCSGDKEEALREVYRYRHLCKAVVAENNPQGIKYAMKLCCLCDDAVRLPLIESSDNAKENIREALEKSDVI